MEIHPNNVVDLPSSPISHYELQPILRSPRQQPKTLMVTSSGNTFHTLADTDTFPDLLNLHPVKSPQRSHHPNQPLNPATLVRYQLRYSDVNL